MAQTEQIERQFREKVCEQVRLVPEGVCRFRVFTPFRHDDGDHLGIVLRKRGAQWELSDEGQTYMRLTYGLDEKDLRRGTRQKIISHALAGYGVEDRDGELTLAIRDEEFGSALYSFSQALLKIADVAYLSRERVRSTFMEDFTAFLTEHVPAEQRQFKWHDERHDPGGMYPVDCRIEGVRKPLFIFALGSGSKVQYATIVLLQFERWSVPFSSMGIYEDQEEINPRVLARFTDVCEKQYSSLSANRERIGRHIEEFLAGT